MKTYAQLQAAALIATVAFAQGAAAEPLGPAPGSALNPAPLNPPTAGRWMDEDGLGTRIPAARTPTGQLYNIPLESGAELDEKLRGWRMWGFLEAGGLRILGDDRSQGWRQHKDLRDGFYVNGLAFLAERPDQARFVEATAGALGMSDQYYRLQVGRYNDWKVAAFYDGSIAVSTTSYRSLWGGVGGNDLRLNSLRPGGSATAAATQANVLSTLASTPETTLDVTRKKAGVRLDKHLSESWKLYASFSDERREGARPFGAVFGGGGGGGNMELTETIDHATRDFVAGIQFSDPLSSFNLRASASFFRNNVSTMAFENPLAITLNGISGLTPALFTRGRFDLAPDNEHFNVRGEYSRSLPGLYRGNFTALVAFGWMRQDDDLLAPTDYELAGGTVTAGGVPLARQWNTTAALGKLTADTRLDTRLVDLGLALRPAAGLDVKGKLRYYETDNASQYLSCNPLTGQWGRLLNDGSGLSLVMAHVGARVNPTGTSANAYNAAACDPDAVKSLKLVPSAGNIPIASAPNDYQQLNASVAGDYRVGRASSVNATLERETLRRDFRERDETWEDRIKVGYVDRGTLDGTIRVSYEHARRGGSTYDPNASQAFRSASLGPTPTAANTAMPTWLQSIEQFRSFDLADRRQNVVNARVDHAFHPNMDGAVTFRMKDAQFPAEYGRTGHQKSNALTFDLNYQAGPAAVVYAFYSHQRGSQQQRGVHSANCVLDYTYYFYSDGRMASTVTGAAAPPTPAGTTLVATQQVVAGNWQSVCGAASATSPLFPESRAWEVRSKDRNDVVGAGVKYDFGKARLDTSFTRSLGRTRIGYSYNTAALGLTDTQAGLAGDGLSDITFAQNVLDASLTMPLGKDMALRFLVRHESGRLRDWHYDGLAANPMPTNNAVYLDGGPQDYRATLLGIFFQLRM